MPGPRPRKHDLLRDRDFLLFWAAEAVSQLGSMVTVVALPLVAVVTLHASVFAVGLLTAASHLAWLLIGLPTGVWVDRVRRRPVMIGADLGRAVLLASVPVAAALGALSFPHLLVVALLTSVLTVFFDVGYQAYLPSIVRRELLMRGNARLSAVHSVTHVGGPGLGGALVQLLGAPFALAADACSFVLSAALLRGIRAVEPAPPRPPRRHLATELAEGLRYVFGRPVLRAIALAGATGNFGFAAYEAVVVVFLARTLGLPATVIGLLLGVTSAGGFVGALVVGPLGRRFGDARLLWVSLAFGTPFGLLVPLATGGAGLGWFVAGTLALGAGIAAYGVCVASFVQTLTPPGLLARTTASVRVVSRGALPVGGLVGGALGQALGTRAALAIVLACAVLAPVWLLLSPAARARHLDDLAATPADSSEHGTVRGS